MDKIIGNCEQCGLDYEIHQNLELEIIVNCPHCGKETENWDTPDSPQMAPSVVQIGHEHIYVEGNDDGDALFTKELV
jgi:uncharacterized protein (DUF983 family)